MAYKEKPRTPEQIRRDERIVNLQDPKARAAIAKLKKERGVRLLDLAAKQKLSHEQRVVDMVERRAAARNDLQLTRFGAIQHSLGLHAGMNKLKLEVEHELVRGYNQQLKAVRMATDQKIDRILDGAERQQKRAQGHTLQRASPASPDRGDR